MRGDGKVKGVGEGEEMECAQEDMGEGEGRLGGWKELGRRDWEDEVLLPWFTIVLHCCSTGAGMEVLGEGTRSTACHGYRQ